MDRYKKKNFKFETNLGLARDLRAVERSTNRVESRHTRFSLLRCLQDEESENQPIEQNEATSRIPTFGKPNLKAPMSRIQMLQKWKEEKQMKRQQELKSKKPTFKAGLAAPKPVSAFTSFANTNKFLSKMDSRMKTFTGSRMKTSTDSRTRFDNKSCSKTIKETIVQPSLSCKSQASSSNNTKVLNNKESGIQSSNRKIPVSGNKNLKMKQEPHIQVPMKSNSSLQKPSYLSAKQVKSQETGEKIPFKSQIVPKKTFTTTTKEVQSKEFHNQLPNKSKATLQKPSFISTRQTKTELISGKTSTFHEKPSTQIKQTGIPLKNSSLPKPLSKGVSKIGLPGKKKEDPSKIFRCEISHIEPSEDKSVAPKGFLFQRPTDLSFSFCDDITAIFSKIRAGTERTSTPKRADLREVEEKSSERSFIVTEESPEIEDFSPKVQDPVSESPLEFSESTLEVKEKEKEYIPIDAASNFDEEYKIDQDSLPKSQKHFDTNKLQTSKKNCTLTENIIENKLETQAPPQHILEARLPVFEESPLLKDLMNSELPEQQKMDLHEKQNPVIVIGDSLPVFEENPLPKDLTSSEFPKRQIIGLHEKRDPANLLEDLPVFEPNKPFLNKVITSEFSQQLKSDLLDDKVPSLLEFPEDKKADLKDSPKQELNLEKLEMQDPAISLPGASSSIFEESGPSFKIPSIVIKLQKKNTEEHKSAAEDVSFINRGKPLTRSSEIKTRSFRRSEMPPLESINESLENSSLLESPAKLSKKEPRKKSILPKDFTPRRSLRLAKLSETDSPECLFDVRPSFYASPPDSRSGAFNSSNLTYDFDNLHLESSSKEEQPVPQRPATRKGKVSLLYTPPPKGRVSSVRKSIKGDLMSFSPDV